MQTTIRELHQSLSSFARDYDGSFSSGVGLPFGDENSTDAFSVIVIDVNGVQWQFNLETSAALVFNAFFPTGTFREPEAKSLTVKVKYGDQEEWKTYNLTSNLQDVSVPVDLTALFTRVMTSGIYTPLPRTAPAPVKKEKKNSTGALVTTVEEITDFLYVNDFITDFDFEPEDVLIRVTRDEAIYTDMAVYLEFKYLVVPGEGNDRIVLTSGTQETLSEKLNAGDFPASNCETADELREALEESFAEWKATMEKRQ